MAQQRRDALCGRSRRQAACFSELDCPDPTSRDRRLLLGRAALPAPLLTLPCVSPQAITTEGKYWKSRIEIVIREYHKWRTYFKKRVSGSGSKESTFRKPRRGGKK